MHKGWLANMHRLDAGFMPMLETIYLIWLAVQRIQLCRLAPSTTEH
jgi:hypothetical protein